MPGIRFGFVLRVPFPILAGVDPLIERVASNIRRHELIPPGARVVVGVSGGLDSVVLLEILGKLANDSSWQLIVAHANHGLRGASSAADERFVRALALRSKVPFRTAALDVRGAMAAGKESVEMAARRLRHAFLAQVHRQRSAVATALAHHADDQVELFFLRLFRGAGGRGLGGMGWSGPSPANPQVRLVRPLLDIRRTELEEFARKHRLAWREDSSNRDRSILRNRIRHELLPLLEKEYCPGIRTVIPRCMDIVRTDAEFVEQEVHRRDSAKDVEVPFEHLAVARAKARRMLGLAGAPANFATVTTVLDNSAASPGKTAKPGTTPPGPFLRGRRKVRLGSSVGQVQFHGMTVMWERRKRPLPWAKSTGAFEQFDADCVGQVITLRHWQPGDRFRPLGFPVSAKLQDLFINRKVPASERRHRLVATSERGEIHWVQGLPPGEEFKVCGNTKTVLVWNWGGGRAQKKNPAGLGDRPGAKRKSGALRAPPANK